MTKRLARKGFTLIEVLAAMAVLMIIVLMLTRVFRDATNAWTIGTRQMEDNVNGRAVLDFIARDISQAMTSGTNCCFRLISSNWQPYTFPDAWRCDELYFVSFSGDGSYREAREIVYYVTNMYRRTSTGALVDIPGRYALRRAMRDKPATLTCYNNAYWWKDVVKDRNDPVVAENIAAFVVWCTGATNDAAGNAYYWYGAYDYNTPGDLTLMTCPYVPVGYDRPATVPFMKGKLPVWIDLYIETLGEDVAVKASQLQNARLSSELEALIDGGVRKYFTRVYFDNRTGCVLNK